MKKWRPLFVVLCVVFPIQGELLHQTAPALESGQSLSDADHSGVTRELVRFSDQPHLAPQLGHSSVVLSAVFSLDGQLVLTGSADGAAALWDAATGRELRHLTGHMDKVTAVVFSPDGRFLLTGSEDKTARLWDIPSGKEVRRFIHEEMVGAVAFSPNGHWVLTTGWKSVARLWDTMTGQEVRQFIGHESYVSSVAFSPDGRWVLTGSDDFTARLWDFHTGQEVRRFDQHYSRVIAVAFSPDGQQVLIARKGSSIILSDIMTGKEVRKFGESSEHDNTADWALLVSRIAFSPDGRWVLTGHETAQIYLWETTSGKKLQTFKLKGNVTTVAFSPNGRFVLTATQRDSAALLLDVMAGQEVRQFRRLTTILNAAAFSQDWVVVGGVDGTAHLWSTTTGREVAQFKHESNVAAAAISGDGQFVLTGSNDRKVALWRTSGQAVHQFDFGSSVTSVAFSPDGRWVLTGGLDDLVQLRETATGKKVRHFYDLQASTVAFSPDGQFILTGSEDGTVSVWETSTGRGLRRFRVHREKVMAVAFSPDGRWVLTGGDYVARLWETATGRQVGEFTGHSDYVQAVTFSPDGQRVLTASLDGTARIWDTRTRQEVRVLRGHSGKVTQVTPSPDGRYVLTTSRDGTARLWDMTSGKELARLLVFEDATWTLVDAKGRFDTNNLEEIKGLHWVMPDDPAHALPVEIFMRDYYEPRLLPRILAREPFSPIRSLAELNRVQPKVEIVGIEKDPAGSGAAADTVTMTVRVSGARGTFGLADKQREMTTGVYDLRLFRDGQLVGQWPMESAMPSKPGVSADDERAQWRTERRVARLEQGTKKIVFSGIRLPRLAGVKEVEFTAYAFNEDRVKSETARFAYMVPSELAPRPGRAYVVTVGVNSFEDASWNLNYAANDARQAGSILQARLARLRDAQGGKRYEQVIWIPLISEKPKEKSPTPPTHATKAHIEAVLKTLAGQPVDAARLADIPGAAALQRVRPEDLVIIMISTHGVVDKQRGTFYFLPANIGTAFSGMEEQWERAVSNDELAAWMRGLDARDQVMIIDACHSAATVQSAEFKPGPMGSRGLGQLAYDQGMRILAATQVDQYALETSVTELGLLSYALLHDGLEDNQADYRPKDGHILISEWLSYAAERVPKLYRQTEAGEKELKGRARGEVIWTLNEKPGQVSRASLQQPQLFDFARRSDALIDAIKPLR